MSRYVEANDVTVGNARSLNGNTQGNFHRKADHLALLDPVNQDIRSKISGYYYQADGGITYPSAGAMITFGTYSNFALLFKEGKANGNLYIADYASGTLGSFRRIAMASEVTAKSVSLEDLERIIALDSKEERIAMLSAIKAEKAISMEQTNLEMDMKNVENQTDKMGGVNKKLPSLLEICEAVESLFDRKEVMS